MNSINFPAFFDNFLLAPSFKRADIRKWFKENTNKKGVYAVFNQQFEPLYIGSSINMPKRIPDHLYQDKLKGHFDEVLFIGIKYTETGDPLTEEMKFIRELQPKLNKYMYIGGE